MYKFVQTRSKLIIFFLDMVGFTIWKLYWFVRPWRWRKNHYDISKTKNILLIRADYIGDVLLTTHTLKAIREKFPQALITFMSSRKASPLLTNNPFIDKVIIYNPPWFFCCPLLKAVKEYIVIWKLFRRAKFDLAIDFRDDARNILLLMVVTGIPYRVSIGVSGGHYLLSKTVAYIPNLHQSTYHSQLAEAVGANITTKTRPQIFLTRQEKQQADNFIKINFRQDSSPMIIVAPGARQKVRLWPLKRYAEVGRHLIRECSAQLLLAGGADERDQLIQLQKLIGTNTVINQPDMGCLRLLYAFMERAQLFIGVSSGASHLAGTAELKSVLLFGPETQEQWQPWGNEHIILQHKFSCSPCNQNRCQCPPINCIMDISTSEVIKAAKLLLDHPKKLPSQL